MHATTLSANEIDRLAQRRAAARLGVLVHASVFAIVNLSIALLSLLEGRPWPPPGSIAWACGLCIHALAVRLQPAGAGLYQRLLQRERARLAARVDPW